MRTLALALPLLATACSRAVSIPGPPTVVDVPVSPSTAAAFDHEDAASSEHGAHAVRLEDEPSDPEMPSPLLAAIQPGEVPNPAHPAGTAYVAEPTAGPTPAALAEWDLATGIASRRVALPLPKTEGAPSLKMVRAGDRLFLTAAAWNESFAYIELTTDLRIVHADPVAGTLSAKELASPHADGGLVAILSTGHVPGIRAPADVAFALTTWDPSGRRIAARYASLDDGPFSSRQATDHSVLVLGGTVFVLLVHQQGGSGSEEVVRLNRSLQIEKRATVRTEPYYLLRLDTRAGHLVVTDTGESPAPPIELSTDLVRLPASPPTDDSRWPGFGDETVTLCRGHDMVWIGWMRGPGDACSAPPAP